MRFWGIPKLHYVVGDRTLCGRYAHEGEEVIEQPAEEECCRLCLRKLKKKEAK